MAAHGNGKLHAVCEETHIGHGVWAPQSQARCARRFRGWRTFFLAAAMYTGSLTISIAFAFTSGSLNDSITSCSRGGCRHDQAQGAQVTQYSKIRIPRARSREGRVV